VQVAGSAARSIFVRSISSCSILFMRKRFTLKRLTRNCSRAIGSLLFRRTSRSVRASFGPRAFVAPAPTGAAGAAVVNPSCSRQTASALPVLLSAVRLGCASAVRTGVTQIRTRRNYVLQCSHSSESSPRTPAGSRLAVRESAPRPADRLHRRSARHPPAPLVFVPPTIWARSVRNAICRCHD